MAMLHSALFSQMPRQLLWLLFITFSTSLAPLFHSFQQWSSYGASDVPLSSTDWNKLKTNGVEVRVHLN